MNKSYRFFLLLLVATMVCAPPSYSQSTLLDQDYLNRDSNSSFTETLNNLTSEEHLNALSFTNILDNLTSDEHLNALDFDNVINNTNTGDSNSTTTGSTGNDDPADDDELVLLNTTPDGDGSNSNQNSTFTNDTAVGYTDSNYWRAWRAASENERKQEIYEGTYQPEKAITLGNKAWSFTYWPWNHCGLSYFRVPTIYNANITDPAQARAEKHKLSPLEAYDTWYYNTYGKNPHAAAWEAAHHNTGKDGARKIENSNEYAQYWILKKNLVKLGSLPFSLKMPDGRPPEYRTARDPEIINYTLTTRGKTFEVPGQINLSERNYFASHPVEEFHIPLNGVNELAMAGMDTKYTVYRFNEQGYPVEKLGQYSWNEIQSNPTLKKNHKQAKQPEFIRLFRTINTNPGYEGGTINWYYVQYEIKPGLSEYSWWGHCGGWSAASINTPLPKEIPIEKDLGKEITLVRLKTNSPAEAVTSSGDLTIKVDDSDYELIPTKSTKLYIQPAQYFGVATVMWNVADENVTNREDPFYGGLNIGDFQGNRIYENTPKTGELAEKYMSDIYPNHLFSVLMHHIGERKEGIVCDTSKGAQVWNSPVRGFTYSHTWVPTPGDEISAGYYSLALYIDYVPYGGLNHSNNPSDFIIPNKWPEEWRGYKAKLFVDKKTHRVYRGEWDSGTIPFSGAVNSKDDHPDFCWIPVSPKYPEPLHQNHNVDDDKAEEFLKQ